MDLDLWSLLALGNTRNEFFELWAMPVDCIAQARHTHGLSLAHPGTYGERTKLRQPAETIH